MITKPNIDEFPAMAAVYINAISDNADILSLMSALKLSTFNSFSKLDNHFSNQSYSKGKWSIKETLGHMIDVERTLGYRAFCFSRCYTELPGFDHELYVKNVSFNDVDIYDLASEFRHTRESNLYLFKSLSNEQLNKTGLASGNLISVKALIYYIAGHEIYHINFLNDKYKGAFQ